MKSNIDCSTCFEQDNSSIVDLIKQNNKRDDNVPEFFNLIQDFDENIIDDLYAPPQDKTDIATISDCDPYPKKVLQEALAAKHRVEFGSFIPINHYSCTIDNKLLIWPMEKPDSTDSSQPNDRTSDIITLEEKCELITCVSCGPTDQQIFSKKATHIIVVASNRSIVIYPVLLENNIVIQFPIRTSLRMCIVTSIAISDQSKIFLGSDTGDIYLVSYRKSQCNMEELVIDIKNLTQYPIISFFQRLFPFTYPNITQLSLCTLQDNSDNTNNPGGTSSSKNSIYIASLDTNSRIIFYHFTSKGKNYSLREISRFPIKKKKQKKIGKIVKVVAVPISDSRTTRFIAFTLNSDRLFFNEREDSEEIYLHQVRHAPSSCSDKELVDAHYSLGVTVFMFRSELVITQTTQNAHIANMNPTELIATYRFKIPTNNLIFARNGHIFSNSPFRIFNNEMLWQHLITSSQGYLMTARGVNIITFSLPADRLSRVLTESHWNYTENVANWMRKYGLGSESSACTLILASRSAEHEKLNALAVLYQYTNEKIRQDFYSISNEMNSTPNSIMLNSINRDSQSEKWSRFYNSSYSNFSGIKRLPESCSSFIIRTARLMKPIWDCPVFTTYSSQQQNFKVINPIFNQLPTNFLKNLDMLIELANKYLDIKSKQPKCEGTYLDETDFFKKFVNYMKTVYATITFIQNLNEEAFKEQNPKLLTDTMNNLDSHYQDILLKVPFGESNDNHLQQSGNSLFESLREFAFALFKTQNNLQSLKLQFFEKCPEFFNEADSKILDALESIECDDKNNNDDNNDRSNTKSQPEQSQNLQKACDVFVKYSNRPLKLDQIRAAFEKHQFYKGIIEVCISRASSLDKEQVALQWYKNGAQQDDLRGKEAFDKRYSCYEYVFKVHELQRTFEFLPETSDELFHICLYEYLIYQLKDEDHLIRLFSCTREEPISKDHSFSASQYLEAYLEDKAKQHLWKFQARRGRYDLAAKSLLELVKDKEDRCFIYVKMNHNKNDNNNDDDNECEIPNLKKRASLLLKVISFARGSGNALLFSEAQRLYQLACIQESYNEKVHQYDQENHKLTFDGEKHFILDQQTLFDKCCDRGYWDLILKLLSFCAISTNNKEMNISRIWTNYLIEVVGQNDFQHAQHSIVTLVNNLYNNPYLCGTGKGSRIEAENDILNSSIVLPLLENFKYNNKGPLMWACETLLKCGLKPELLYRQYLKIIDHSTMLEFNKKADFVYIIAQLVKQNLNHINNEHWQLVFFVEGMNWFIENGMEFKYYDDCFHLLNEIKTLL